VARVFAREGAAVCLAGRTLERLDEVAKEIRSAGGVADAAHVDALDERSVDEHADAVAATAGAIDISFNLITGTRREPHSSRWRSKISNARS
jgi:NADP-dependent 3-hydroxy acid dehydrogenase YdfG